MGENMVLGTRDDENKFEPTLVHPKMFFECDIREVGAGAQHVVVLAGADKDDQTRPEMDNDLI